MKKHLGRKIAAGVLALVLIALVLVGNYLVSFAIARKQGVNMEVVPASVMAEEDVNVMNQNLQTINQQTKEWAQTAAREAAEIISDDGLKLKGDLFRSDVEETHRWLLAIHGYTGRRSDMWDVAGFYAGWGYHVLTPDMRAHGESEGDYIGMGWLDRKDVLKWIDYIIELDPEAEIILHGISMGGAAVMMTSGEKLPEQVKGIVEDCGYTSVWDIFDDELAYLFHLPAFPILYIASGISSLRAGYSFGEASALEQVKKSEVPILFIHGDEDNFVHTEMVYKLYEACTSPKDILVIEGAGHGAAYGTDPDLYFSTVYDFLERECGI